MSTGAFLLALNLIAVLLIAQVLLNSPLKQQATTSDVVNSLGTVFGFFEIVDSRYLGLTIFMISNYFTGSLRLVIADDTHSQSATTAYAIIFLNSVIFTFIPFAVFYKVKLSKRPVASTTMTALI
jgi:hypothetical protein